MKLIDEIALLANKVSNIALLPNFAKVDKHSKEDGSWLTQADTQAHQLLMEALPKLVNYPVLSEELTALEQQKIIDQANGNYWCVDPLDGTSNFTQGIPYWCMSIALIENGKMSLAVVYDPNRDECFTASREAVSQLNGKPLNSNSLHEKSRVVKDNHSTRQDNELTEAMGLIDFKRLEISKRVAIVSNPPYRSQRSFGASALDFCWIAANRCQIYLHGKQKLWDYAAGLLVLQKAGGFAETFESRPVFENDLSPKSVIAANNQELMKKWKTYFHSI